MSDPVFAEGVTTPVRLAAMKEVFHPSAGERHSHWFYEFEPDMDQGALMDMIQDEKPDDDADLETLMLGEQRAVVSPFRLGTRRAAMDLCVGDLFDVILVRRDPIPVPEMGENALQRLLRRLFEPSEAEDGDLGKIVTIVPLVDIEAAEYDAPPDMAGLPDLRHVDPVDWEVMSMAERLGVIAQARKEQR